MFSIVRNSLNEALVSNLYTCFSNSTNHAGAKWTFLSKTQVPALPASLIILEANSKASGLPIAQALSFLPVRLASSSTLKLASNPGALTRQSGLFGSHLPSTSACRSTYEVSIASSLRACLMNEAALGANLSGLSTLMITICFRRRAPLLVAEQSFSVIHGSGTYSSGF